MISETIVSIAKSYIGKTEKPNNSGFNDAEFQAKMEAVGWKKGLAWCAYFSELVWKEAYQKDNSKVLPVVLKLFSGSALQTYNNFKVSKDFIVNQEPVIGALAIWRHGNTALGHVAIVSEMPQNGKFKTIEGNTNDKGGREGYIVAEKTRSLNFTVNPNDLYLLGFVHPKQ